MENTFLSYFNSIFSSFQPSTQDIEDMVKYVPSRVSDSRNKRLSSPFGREEVLTAVKQMYSTKSPSPDDFLALFYQHYWNIVGQELMEACLNSLNNHMSISNWNNTFIALIPKVKNPRTVSDYRLISLCNVSYKIVTKAIANRLKGIMDLVISDT